MTTQKTNKYLHILLGLVCLIAGIINGLSNPFYPCALTLVPAGILFFFGTIEDRELWKDGFIQIFLAAVSLGILYAGVWELLIFKNPADLHYFCVRAIIQHYCFL